MLAVLVALGVVGLVTIAVIDLLSGESAGDDVGVTVEDVLEDTERYARGSVTVNGRVRRIGTGAFAVGGDRPAEQLLLLTTAHTRGTPAEGGVVQIIGTVRSFEPDVLLGRHPFVASLRAEYLEPYDGRPAVIVRSFSQPPESG